MYNKNYINHTSRNFKLAVANSSTSMLAMSAYNLIIIWVTLKITGNTFIAGLSDSMDDATFDAKYCSWILC